jgi:Ca2+-transporting ATPase
MTVEEIFIDDKQFKTDNMPGDNSFNIFMQILSLCNDSKVSSEKNGKINFIGDPTETALVDFAYKNMFSKSKMDELMPRVGELPFDSDRKLMTTINKIEGKYRILTKGAPDVLLKRCKKIYVDGVERALTDADIAKIRNANRSMAAKALRILAAAYKDTDTIPENMDSESIENDLVLVGLVGMIDPPREEVKEAVDVCMSAGIRPIMITGDHKDTAAAIAREIGIINNESEVITGIELDKISDKDFEHLVEKYSVYARVSPEHKVRIVKAWKKKGKVVAMTGDGVNDAPALKSADIGIGMGITGTDVAKSVSNMVLSDDNFATIVLAVEEGRKIYSNIKKKYLFQDYIMELQKLHHL